MRVLRVANFLTRNLNVTVKLWNDLSPSRDDVALFQTVQVNLTQSSISLEQCTMWSRT
jgi:hypothetical protein